MERAPAAPSAWHVVARRYGRGGTVQRSVWQHPCAPASRDRGGGYGHAAGDQDRVARPSIPARCRIYVASLPGASAWRVPKTNKTRVRVLRRQERQAGRNRLRGRDPAHDRGRSRARGRAESESCADRSAADLGREKLGGIAEPATEATSDQEAKYTQMPGTASREVTKDCTAAAISGTAWKSDTSSPNRTAVDLFGFARGSRSKPKH
jgi:hypothetical protein